MTKLIYAYLMYLCVVNAVAFLTFGMDKLKARRNKRRISEKALILLCAFGGAVGGLLGMMIFHHKTRKTKFVITVPLFALIHTALIIWIMFN